MIIDYQDGVFVAQIAIQQKQSFQDAGWKWDRIRLRWTTRDLKKAIPFRAFATSSAEEAFKASYDAINSALAMSYAEDMDVDIPVPAGLAYDPFQKPGIVFAAERNACLIGDDPGLGKGGPLWEKILTPTGWTTYGDVKVGDAVVGSDGEAYAVIGVYDRGVLPVFRVWFSDGTSAVVDREHLWNIKCETRKNRKGVRVESPWKIVSTGYLEEKGKYPNGSCRKLRIPVVAPVQFSGKTDQKLITPYVLGVLLGDGCIKYRTAVSSADQEILNRVSQEIPENMRLTKTGKYDYVISNSIKGSTINIVRSELKRLGLHGHGSDTKFVPDEYLISSIPERIALLQGLLDTDGYISGEGTIQFSSNSEALVEGVEFLVRSLAGIARRTSKISASGKTHYITTLCFPDNFEPFYLERKKIRHMDRVKYNPAKIIRSVQYEGQEHVKCISVNSPDNLYITNDFIVTHNTVQAIGVSNYLPPIRRVLLVVPAHLKINWEREWLKWDVKHLTVGQARTEVVRTKLTNPDGSKLYHEGTNRQQTETHMEYVWPHTDVVIINYDMLQEFHDEVRSVFWDFVICDEAQYLAHENTTRARNVFGGGIMRKKKKRKEGVTSWKTHPAVSEIPAKKRLFLSGTPILSRPSDLWTLVKACDPYGLGRSWDDFARTYCNAQEIVIGKDAKGGLKYRLDSSGASNLDILQVKLRTTFMIRRNKSRVLKNMPPKRRKLVPLPNDGLTKLVGREISAATRVRNALAEFEGILVEPEAPIDWEQFANKVEYTFEQYAEMPYEERATHLAPAIEVAFEEWATVRKELAAAKIKMVVEHVKNLMDTGEKVIIFVVHTEMAEALKEEFPNCAFITGKVPGNKRQAQVDRFQNDPTCNPMIGNIVAAGSGFTMTASRWTVFAELDWIASRIVQAEDRVWRRGQKFICMSEHLVVEGTSDAHMVGIFLRKLEIEQAALDDSTLPKLDLEQQMLLERMNDLDAQRHISTS